MSKLDDLINELCPNLPAGRQVEWSIKQLPNDENLFYTYVLVGENGSLYKGFTNNLKRRFEQHCNGTGADYTKKYKPLGVIYYEVLPTQEEAVNREKYFKSGCGREWLKSKLKEVLYDRCK